jgi:hypothetical protein
MKTYNSPKYRYRIQANIRRNGDVFFRVMEQKNKWHLRLFNLWDRYDNKYYEKQSEAEGIILQNVKYYENHYQQEVFKTKFL